jgi:hypothetical protein
MTTYRLSNLNAELHEGDIGTEIIVTIYDITETDGVLDQSTPLDLTGFTVTILLCGASGTMERDATLVGLASAGTVKAITQDGDLVEGPLTIRAKVVRDSDDATSHTAGAVTRVHAVC